MDKYSQKDTFTFPHDANAAADHKCIDLIEKLGTEGYGIYWLLLEGLRREPTFRLPLSSVPGMARHYNSTPEKFKAVVTSFKLFKLDKEWFWSEALIRRMAERLDFHIEMTKMAYKRYKKDPPPEKLINPARALLSQYGGNALVVPTHQDSSNLVVHKISKEKQSEDKQRKEKNAERDTAAAFADINFKEYFEKKKKDFPEIDHTIELESCIQWWTGKKLDDPKRAWLNWLKQARYINQRGRKQITAPAVINDPLANITPRVSGEDQE